MDSEIDLRPYFVALLRHMRLIAGLALIGALLAGLLTMVAPRGNEATTTLLIAPATSQITLDQRYLTRDATMLTNVNFQRQALLGLAESNAISQRVLAEVPSVAGLSPVDLLQRVEVENNGDLIVITTFGESEADALMLAEAWGRNYERLVAEVYSRNVAGLALIDEQLIEAQTRYDQTQADLEQFLGETDLVVIDQQIKRLTTLLEGSSSAGSALYTQYLSRTQELDFILADARALQDQLASNESDQLADRLAALALRARSAGGSAAVATTQLQIIDPEALAADPDAAQADLNQLIDALAQQRADLSNESARLADAIASGATASVGLTADARRSYEQELTMLRQQFEQLQSRQRTLQQSRDIAFSSLEILQRKREEQQIAQTTPLISVSYLSSTIAAPPSLIVRTLMQSAVGLVFGAFLAILIALYLDVVRPRIAKLTGSEPAPADRPVASP